MSTVIKDVLVRWLADTSGVEKGAKNLQNVMSGVKKTLTLIGAGWGVAELIQGLKGAVNASVEFNKSMSNVATLIPGSKDRVLELKEAISALSPTVNKSVGDLAEGTYQIISAFGDTGETVKLLELNAKAAAAGMATTIDSINLLSAVTKGYGDTSFEAQQKAADLAFQTIVLGQTTFPELAASIGRVIPLASSLGVAQEEMFAIMATGTGVFGNAAEVSTQLRGAMQAFLAPSASAVKLFKEIGVSSGEALIKQEGLVGALKLMVDKANETGEPLQDYIGSIEGITLALGLTGEQHDTFKRKLGEMDKAAGSTNKAFSEVAEGINSAGFKMGEFQKHMDNAKRNIGDTLLTVITPLAGTFAQLAEKSLPKLTSVLDPLMKALEPVLALFTDVLATTIESIADCLYEVALAFGDINEVLVLCKPVIDAVVNLFKLSIKEMIDNITEKIKHARLMFEEFISFFKNIFKGDWKAAWQDIKDMFKLQLDGIVNSFTGFWKSIDKRIEAMAGEYWKKAKEWGINIWNGLVKGLTEGLKAAWDSVKGVFDSFTGKVKGLFGIKSPSTVFEAIGIHIVQGFEKGLEGLVESNKKLLKNMKGFLEDFVEYTDLLESVSGDVFKRFVEGFKSFIDSLNTLSIDLMKQFGGDLEKAEKEIGDALITFLKFLESIADRINEEFNSDTNSLFAQTTNYFQKLGDKLATSLGALDDALKDISFANITRVFKEMQEMFSTFFEFATKGVSVDLDLIMGQLQAFLNELIEFCNRLNELLYGSRDPLAGFITGKTLIDELSEALEGSFKKLNEVFENISLDNVNKFMASLKSFIDYIWEIGSMNFIEIKNRFETVFKEIGKIFTSSTWTDTVAKLDIALKQYKETIVTNLEDSIVASKAKWEEFIGIISQKADIMSSVVTPKLVLASEAVRTAFTGDIEVIKNSWTDAIDIVSAAATSFELQINSMLEFLKAVASGEGIDTSGIRKTFEMLTEYVTRLTMDLYNAIFKPVLEGFADALLQIPQAIYDNLVAMMAKFETAIIDIVTNAAKRFQGAWTSALESFANGWVAALKKVKEEANSFRNWFTNWVTSIVDAAMEALGALMQFLSGMMEVIVDFYHTLLLLLELIKDTFLEIKFIIRSFTGIPPQGEEGGGGDDDDDFIVPPYRPPYNPSPPSPWGSTLAPAIQGSWQGITLRESSFERVESVQQPKVMINKLEIVANDPDEMIRQLQLKTRLGYV